ncbi:MAG TPA: tyrosine-type recombinase/integrase [Ktedonosporobacter sp.]|nr:tyrosine-type recombinase/integrase [Ktedonosporobacter sp.]
MGRTSKTRSYGYGSVYKDGNYYAVKIPASMGGGKKRFKTEQEAERWKKEQIWLAARGERVNSPSVTMAEYLQSWLDGRAGIEPSTKVDYQGTFTNHIIPVIGQVQLAKLTPSHCASIVSAMQEKGLSANSIHSYMARFQKALTDAIKRGILAKNPMVTVELPKMTRCEIELPLLEEITCMIEVARHEVQSIGSFIMLGLTTGLRCNELLALHWKHINFEKKTLIVRYSIQNTGNGLRLATPKTNAGFRTIRLADVGIEALHLQCERVAIMRLLAGGKWDDNDLVFPALNGSLMHSSVMRSMFSRWLKRNGFVRMNIHRMRHIAASLLIAQGVPVKVVQEFLGHSNVTMTLTVYTHTSEQLHRDAVNHFDRLFTGMQ